MDFVGAIRARTCSGGAAINAFVYTVAVLVLLMRAVWARPICGRSAKDTMLLVTNMLMFAVRTPAATAKSFGTAKSAPVPHFVFSLAFN